MPSSKLPFVDFYSSHGIIPTRQDISDFQRHVERRVGLYRQLGLPPFAVHGASVLEFGPGSGHNSVVTGLLKPDRYLLVDANPPSLKSTRKILKERCPGLKFELRESPILQFRTKEKFDLVLCEGVIPTQKNPPAFLRHVASFVRPGGVVVHTCMDSISLLPEMLRRWLVWDLIKDVPDFNERVARLVKFFQPDLKALPGMSRLPEDWVIDQLLHPWSGSLFSIPQAIRAIGSRGVLLSASPNFLLDWRWYKSITGPEANNSQFGLDSYYSLAINLIDFRFRMPQTDPKKVAAVERVCTSVYDGVFGRERGEVRFGKAQLLPLLLTLQKALREQHPQTQASLASFIRYLRTGNLRDLAEFRKWWGRGQQYLSFVMNR